ncbi:MAG: insulinase family protein [Rhizobiaceae bacterium]|nr:insulinase family protein [Rhizobiaceae bacterium]MCV0405660.1 insulinase family protein [Rhizobiaceae bacterium]
MGVLVSRLSNGMTVATERLPGIETVALGVWIKSGSRNETDDEHGIAHLLEHMAFKGTGTRSAYDIASQIEDVGGEINAATSVETTAFYARVLKDDIPLAMDLLSDILTDSIFDPEELRREQHVILQEIGAAHDTPDDIVFDKFTETAFRHQTLGRSILGTPDTVESFTSDQLRAFMDRQYAAERMVIVAAGSVDHDSFVKLAERHFGGFRARSESPIPRYASYVGGDYREFRELMDAQVILGFEGRAYHVRDFYASQLLSMILGGGMSSRLFQEVRERRGLCYSVYAFHWGFSDTGVFGIHAATGKEDMPQLIPVIIEELRKAGQRIDRAEVDRARAQYRAALAMSAESAGSRASQIARQIMLYGAPVTREELMDRLSNITVERLTDLSARLFATQPTVAAIGPIGTLSPFETIRDSLGYVEAASPRRIAV